ncbi:MAG: toprim domain-containing protein, partial [Actinomycetia bacterium]|nr:toprim domain-containing protein [Actinomycetes bacterium]
HEQKHEAPPEPQVLALSEVEGNKIEILKKVFSYYENALLNSKHAKDYCKQRNLDYSKLQIGYNTGTFHNNNKGLVPQLETLGLIKKHPQGGHNVFGKGCIVSPLKNKKGEITGLYFRGANGNKENKHYYLKDRQGLYPKYPPAGTTKLIITESLIDAATLQQIPEITNGYELLSSYGTNGITGEHKAAIKGLAELEEIILFFDGDGAGREGSRARAGELHQLKPGIKISYVETPEGEDINSLSIGRTPELFTELLNNRKPFLFSSGKKENAKAVPSAAKQMTINGPMTNNATGKLPAVSGAELNTGNPHKISYSTQTATYYIKGGLPKALDSLKITLEVEHPETGRKSRTKPDLFEDKQVEKVSREAGEKLGIRADLIELDLNYLTDLLDGHREQQIKENEPAGTDKKVTVPQEQQQKAIQFLKQRNLIKEFNKLIEKAGISGETNNRIFLFVIATSYKMPDTLHALIQGSSGSGKTYLSRQVTDLMPKEDVIRLTRVTESSFYNFGEYEIQYKLIVLEDIEGLKEEAEYAFRELQSNGEITSGVSAKNESSGHFSTVRRTVRGPIGSIATTTKGEIYEDNMSRIFLLAVDEGKEQTNRIINYLNKKSSGMVNKTEEYKTRDFVQNCIRMLKPHEVVNPYANKILLPPEAQKIRRLTELFHAFVNQITLINQYQRKRDAQGRLITEKEDVQTAVEIMFESIVLKIDELDGSLRQFYESLKNHIMKQAGAKGGSPDKRSEIGGEEYQNYQFTQREIRQALNVSKTQMHRYLADLLNLEYITQTGGHSNKGFKYKITYWDDIKALRDRIKAYLNDQLENL